MATVIENGGGGGGSIVDVIAPTKTLAINEVFTLPLSGKQGNCWIQYANEKSVNFNFQTDGSIDVLINKGFGTVVDTAGKVNLYQDGTDIKVQNKTTGSITIKYWPET